MVHLDVVRACNAALVEAQPLVAVFVGGTAGIGEYAVRALAAAHADRGKGLRVYIVGRNESAAEKIITDCLKVCPTACFRLIRANDLSLLKDVDRVCTEIIRAEEEASATGETARVDFLVMTQGYLAFEARKETKEGLDMLLSLLYYSRMRFITQLLPLLLASPLPAHVVSVFGPQRDNSLFKDDLSLRNPQHYSFGNVGSHMAYMTTFFMEGLATRHPGRLALAHYFPGLVLTGSFQDDRLPRWFRWVWRYVASFIVKPFTVPRVECGDRVLFLASSRFPARASSDTTAELPASGESNVKIAVASDGVTSGGAYRVDWNGEMIATKKAYKKLREEGWSEKIRSHTTRAFEVIGAGDVFAE